MGGRSGELQRWEVRGGTDMGGRSEEVQRWEVRGVTELEVEGRDRYGR
jgi:hypothetical protein